LFEMLQGKLPFNTDSEITSKPPIFMTKVSLFAMDLIRKCLTKNPDNRIKLEDVRAHPWIMQGVRL